MAEETVTINKTGVLNCLVKQTIDNTPSENENGIVYCEKFKGSYLLVKECLSHISVGMTLTAAHTALIYCGGLHVMIDMPVCPVRNGINGVWRIDGIRVEELEAGDHAFLYLDTYADYYNLDDGTDDPSQDVWSITWQSYTVDPYSFCSNTPHEDYIVSPSWDTTPYDPQLPYEPAMRSKIDECLRNSPKPVTFQGKSYYMYTPDPAEPDVRRWINNAEKAILEKKMLNRSAIYHYPVVTHQTVRHGSANYTTYASTVGDQIDHVLSSSLSSVGCPYKFPSVWKFVKTGDELHQVKVKSTGEISYTRQEQWSGFTDVDINFYGNGTYQPTEDGILSGRWPIAGM